MKGTKTIWEPVDLMFIYENFDKMSGKQLLAGINSIRPVSAQVELSALRFQCRRMELSHGLQIRWSAEDIAYLTANYKKYGDTELAQHLNKRKKTFRVINGKKVFRVFTKKHVDKKRQLMGLIRTGKEVSAIIQRNFNVLNKYRFTSTDNAWTRGKRKAVQDNETVVWNGVRYIKITGKAIPFARYFYHNFIASIPEGSIVCHLDGDRLNDAPENLSLSSRRGLYSTERLIATIPLLQARERSILLKMQATNYDRLKDKSTANNLSAELNRVRALNKKFLSVIEKRQEAKVVKKVKNNNA